MHFEKVVAGFSRYHKYTLGTELRNKSREVVALIMKANAAKDKRPHLLTLRERLDELLITARIAKVASGILPPATLVHPVHRNQGIDVQEALMPRSTGCTRAAKSFKSFQFAIEQVVSVYLHGCR